MASSHHSPSFPPSSPSPASRTASATTSTPNTKTTPFSDTYMWPTELVVITGGSRGIGAAIVAELRSHNIKVIILDLNPPTTISPATHFYRCNLQSESEISETSAKIRKEHGNPTVLINVAGTWNPTGLLDTSYEQTANLFATNVLAPMQLIKEFAPAMVKRNHGMIVITSSTIAYGGAPPAMVDYAATKAALIALHESVGSELAFRYQAPKIRTLLVIPGFTNTPLTAGLKYDDRWVPMLQPEQLAKGVVGKILQGSGGILVMPRVLGWLVFSIRAWPVWVQKMRNGMPDIART